MLLFHDFMGRTLDGLIFNPNIPDISAISEFTVIIKSKLILLSRLRRN
jgi:hypothetical protein